MIKREWGDGVVHVQRCPENSDHISILVVHEEEMQEIYASVYNVRRLLASLSLILGLPLTAKAQKEIEL